MNLDTFLIDLGVVIAAKRKQMKLNQKKASDDVGISYRYYQSIEAGRANMTAKTMLKLLEYFGIESLTWRNGE